MIKEFSPDLLPKIRDLIIKANRAVLSRSLTGGWMSAFKGHGVEFSEYRQYTAGDDASFIDWRASLRARKLLVKEFQEEKSLRVNIILDVSNSMLYGTEDVLKAERAAEVASSIAYIALRGGDAVGLTMVTDEIAHHLPPNIGVKQHSLIIKFLSDPERYGGAFDFKKTLKEFMGQTKERGLIIFITDFIGCEDGWQHYVRLASTRFEMLGIAIRDRRDRRLPKQSGEYVLEDPYSDEKMIIDCAQYYKPYKEYVEKEEELITEYFRMTGGDCLFLETNEDFVKPLTKFFQKRARKGET